MRKFSFYILTCLMLYITLGCKKGMIKVIPTISTIAASNISSTTITSGGNITSDGGSIVYSRGVCWSSTQNPTIYENKTNDGTGIGVFVSNISGLIPGKIFYIRAYAINNIGIAYGSQITLVTHSSVPTINTINATNITSTSAKTGGNIISDGGSNITSRGVCWSAYQSPTVLNDKTSDGSGMGIFESNLTGLTPGKSYFIRSYATNNIGTSYGNEINVITLTSIPTITTSGIFGITSTTAIGGGNISSDGGSTITSRGICWSKNEYPTINDNFSNDGTGTGSFESNITGLNPGFTYYARAYAINSLGIAYGNQINFNTPLTDIDGNVYTTLRIGTKTWMVENLKTTKYNNGELIPLIVNNTTWSNLGTPGYCYYNNQSIYKDRYGVLYNGYSIYSRYLCPKGWHVSTDEEWINMISYLGGEYIAGGKLKEAGTINWASPNTGATNSIGFYALPGGCRDTDGTFLGIGYTGYWYSSSMYGLSYFYYRSIYFDSREIYQDIGYSRRGYSVRCVKDS